MELINIPIMESNDSAGRLIEFYQKVGWNKEKMLDPCKVKITASDFQSIVQKEMDLAKKSFPQEYDIATGVNMLWLNSGPSATGNTPGKVELHHGWVQKPVNRKIPKEYADRTNTGGQEITLKHSLELK